MIADLSAYVDRQIHNADATPAELDELAQVLFDLAHHLEAAARWRRRRDRYQAGAS